MKHKANADFLSHNFEVVRMSVMDTNDVTKEGLWSSVSFLKKEKYLNIYIYIYIYMPLKFFQTIEHLLWL